MISTQKKHYLPLPHTLSLTPPPSPTVYLHDGEKLVQYVGGSEEHFKSVVKVMVEQTEPLHHTIPIMAADKLGLVTPLCSCSVGCVTVRE